MNFSFKVNLGDKDYLDYNIFWSVRSPYGKQQRIQMRVTIAVLFAVVALAYLIVGKFSSSAFFNAIPFLVLLVLFEVFLNSFFASVLKSSIKSLRKKGKMGYSPVSEMQFTEDGFVETTPDNRTEQKYSAIERVSVIGNKTIYIHVNNVMSYILPSSCFDTDAQREAFLTFIKTKCANVDTYCSENDMRASKLLRVLLFGWVYGLNLLSASALWLCGESGNIFFGIIFIIFYRLSLWLSPMAVTVICWLPLKPAVPARKKALWNIVHLACCALLFVICRLLFGNWY